MPEKSGLASRFFAGSFGIFRNTCTFCCTGIAIGLVVTATYRVIFHRTYTILLRIFLASGFLLAACSNSKKQSDNDEDNNINSVWHGKKKMDT